MKIQSIEKQVRVLLSSIGGLVLLVLSFSVQADFELNSAEAQDVCELAIVERTDGTVYHKFKQGPAISTRGGRYKFWINSTMRNDERKYLLRSVCELSSDGELLSLEIEEGRW